MEKKYGYKDWNEIEECVDLLVKRISARNTKFQSISTVSRGGLVPARLVADRLGIKQIFVDPYTIEFDSLFVDDIYDTGETFRRMVERAEKPDEMVYATLHARPGGHHPKQLVYAKPTEGDEYVIYPWDRFEHGRP